MTANKSWTVKKESLSYSVGKKFLREEFIHIKSNALIQQNMSKMEASLLELEKANGLP